MALQTTTQIFISGTLIESYVSLKLVQEIDAHHNLELVCRTDVVEQLSEELMGNSKDYLGGVVTIQISAMSNVGGYKELEFKGIVVGIQGTKGFHQSSGDLVTLYAKSASIVSDDGGHYASYNDLSLSEILEKTFQGYDQGKLETAFSPVSSETIHYSVQHNQSAFSYASRLAAYYNEWFYYNGSKLIFGKPESEETELKYGVDLQNFSLELKSIPNSFNYFTNDYFTDELHQKSSQEVSIPSEGYHGFTDKKSKELFAKETQVYHNLYNDSSTKPRLDKQVEQYTRAKAMQQVIAKGSSDNPGVNLGEVIKIEGYGSFRIIKIIHTNIEGGVYQNNFEAVDASFDAYPRMDISLFPKSDIQIGVVTENNDPDGLSRIKVQFPWQKPSGGTTPWLRMMTPHAGSEKGFHFIPEVGEEVIVNFEGGNAERPFVMGALYHGTAKPESWKTDANDLKAIRTRSGHTIELDDTQDKEMIKIYDNEGSIITFDTQAKSLFVQATENIEFSAKNIKIIAEENIDVQAKGNISTASEGDTAILSKGATNLQATGDTAISSDASITVDATADAKISGQNLVTEGKVGAELKGQQTKVQGQMTILQGASGKIDVV